MSDEAVIRITVNGRRAYTLEQAARKHNLQPSSMRAVIARAGGQIRAIARLDGKKALYLASVLDRAVTTRPRAGRSKPADITATAFGRVRTAPTAVPGRLHGKVTPTERRLRCWPRPSADETSPDCAADDDTDQAAPP